MASNTMNVGDTPQVGVVLQEVIELQLLQALTEESILVGAPVKPTQEIQGVQLEIQSSPRSTTTYIQDIFAYMMSALSRRGGNAPSSPTWNNPQPFKVMKAVEDKDISFLMLVKDNAFPLLLKSCGGETPLVHAIRIGNKDVATVLIKDFSRWVNQLGVEDVQKPQTQTLLKVLRDDLKFAINEGLAQFQCDLIAAYMQTLILTLSEGGGWASAQVSSVARALNSNDCDDKPAQVAGGIIRNFTTKHLRRAQAGSIPPLLVEDFITKATTDLLLIAAWSNVLHTVNEHEIPSSYLARGDRVYQAFLDRIDRKKGDIQRTCSQRLQKQLHILKDGLGWHSLTSAS